MGFFRNLFNQATSFGQYVTQGGAQGQAEQRQRHQEAQQNYQTMAQRQIASRPQTLSTSTVNTGGSGGGGGFSPAPAPTSGGEIPQESPPPEPSIDFDALIAPALGELNQVLAESQNVYGGAQTQAEAFRESEVAKANTEKLEAAQAVARAGRKAESEATAADTRQRRGFSEMAKGLRARFGSAISTGLGAESILGQETMRNIGAIQQGLQETQMKLFESGQRLEQIFNQRVSQANFEAEQLKQQAREKLLSVSAQIRSQKATLQTRKAELVFNAMENYRNIVAAINQRNTSFQQQLYAQRAEANERIRVAQAQAASERQNLAQFALSPGLSRVVPLSQLGGEDSIAQLEGSDLGNGLQFQRVGDFGVFTNPLNQGVDDDEDLANQIG